MLLAHLLGVADGTGVTGLRFGGIDAHAIFTDVVGSTAIGGVAEVACAAEGAGSLFWDEGIKGQVRSIGEAYWRGWQVWTPVKLAAGYASAGEDIR